MCRRERVRASGAVRGNEGVRRELPVMRKAECGSLFASSEERITVQMDTLDDLLYAVEQNIEHASPGNTPESGVRDDQGGSYRGRRREENCG